MTSKKWKRGRRLTAIEALVTIAEGNPVYWNQKWTHNGWARSWQINMVIAAAGNGRIFSAEKADVGS